MIVKAWGGSQKSLYSEIELGIGSDSNCVISEGKRWGIWKDNIISFWFIKKFCF